MSKVIAILHATIAIIVALLLAVIEPICNLFIPRSTRRKDVTGKIVLVTGGGSGLGRGIAKRLAERGCIIVSFDVNEAGNTETKKLVEGIGGKCYIYTVDLCDRFAIYRAADAVKKEVGKVDILFNNAGIVSGRELLDTPDEMILRTFDVNILSYIWTIKAFLPGMIDSNSGQIVMMSSIAGFIGIRKQTDYAASKYAVRGLDEALTQELLYNGYNGITVTTVFPYYFNTGMFEGTNSKILSIMDEKYVADEVTDGIVMQSKEIILPPVMTLLVGLFRVVSYRGASMVNKAFGTADMMNTFKGRTKVE